ncbi:hypothetical protein FRC15_007806 [Serendipita sp. 397]|nr:hypothetical protein FRC15_007806 [Serendipita sp. 397]KAG8788414.1 hypothetical protein FRC16_001406 [Serendipita sp. 398]
MFSPPNLTRTHGFAVTALVAAVFLSNLTGYFPSYKAITKRDSVLNSVDPIEVVVPSCPELAFNPYNYDNAVAKAWMDLRFPTGNPKGSSIDPEAATYKDKPSYDNYGREHIYEVQLIALFIDALRADATGKLLWDGWTLGFCDWVDTFVFQPLPSSTEPALINTLRKCLPYDNNPNQPYMPWLEEDANSIKASAMNGDKIRTEATFKKYDWTERVATMRTTAAVMSYMTDTEVLKSLVMQSNCIEKAWVDWLGKYVTVPKIPPSAPKVKADDMKALYQRWYVARMKQFKQNLLDGMETMIQWCNIWNTSPPIKARVNWNNELSSGPEVTLTLDNLKYLKKFIEDIPWKP